MTRTVVGGVLFARNHRLWVEQLSVGTRLHSIDGTRLEVNVERPRNMLATVSLREEGRKTAVVVFFALTQATVRLV